MFKARPDRTGQKSPGEFTTGPAFFGELLFIDPQWYFQVTDN